MKTTILTVVFALAIVGIPTSFATNTQVDIVQTSLVLDLDSSNTVKAYVQFVGFDSSDKSFVMKVINPTNVEVYSSTIYVTSTSSGLVNFNTFVMYHADNDIPSGDYEIQITNNNGNVLASVPLQIIAWQGYFFLLIIKIT